MTSHVPSVIDAHLHRFRALSGLESIHRVVCGDCHDFKLIVTLHESNFAVWECDEFTFEADVVKQSRRLTAFPQSKAKRIRLRI